MRAALLSRPLPPLMPMRVKLPRLRLVLAELTPPGPLAPGMGSTYSVSASLPGRC